LDLATSRDDFFSSFSDGGAAIGAIYHYAPTRTSKWQVYNGSLPAYVVQTLTTYSRSDGYYLVLDGSTRYQATGYFPYSWSITLRPGMNLVGYPVYRTQGLSEALLTINDSYRFVETYEGLEVGTLALRDVAPPGGDNLTNMSISHAYWINVSTTDVWTVSR